MALILIVTLCVPAATAENYAQSNGKSTSTSTVSPAKLNPAQENKSSLKVTVSKSVKAGIGKKVTFTVKVSGASGKVTYTWQESTNGKKWTTTKENGAKTKQLKVTVKDDTFGKQYRCVVKDKKGKVNSSTVKVNPLFTVKVSPAKAETAVGKKGKFTVTAKGTSGSVKYQWMYSENGGKTWKKTKESGAKKKVLQPKASNATYGMLFRCEVTDKKGKMVSPTVYLEPAGNKSFTFKKSGSFWVLTGYKGNADTVTLPAGHQGRKVISLAKGVFKGNNTLKKVTVPPSYTSLGASAFEGCKALKSVTLSDSITEIGKACFKSCPKLESMNIVNK